MRVPRSDGKNQIPDAVEMVLNKGNINTIPGTVGHYFDIFYGQKELHSRDGMVSSVLDSDKCSFFAMGATPSFQLVLLNGPANIFCTLQQPAQTDQALPLA